MTDVLNDPATDELTFGNKFRARQRAELVDSAAAKATIRGRAVKRLTRRARSAKALWRLLLSRRPHVRARGCAAQPIPPI